MQIAVPVFVLALAVIAAVGFLGGVYWDQYTIINDPKRRDALFGKVYDAVKAGKAEVGRVTTELHDSWFTAKAKFDELVVKAKNQVKNLS